MRIHARNLTRSAFAGLAVAVTATVISVTSPQAESGNPVHPESTSATAAIPSEAGSGYTLIGKDNEIVRQITGEPLSIMDAYTRLTDASRTEEGVRPAEKEGRNIHDPSVVALISMDESGRGPQIGTGTIVKGELETDRILAAAHFAPRPGDKVVAFASDGRALAIVQMTMTLDTRAQGASRIKDVTVEKLANDAAVYQATDFLTAEGRDGWNARGATIAANQPAEIMLITNSAEDTSFDPGMTGGTLRNDTGEIVGMMLAASSSFLEPGWPHRSEFVENMKENDDYGVFVNTAAFLGAPSLGDHSPRGHVGFAAPVLNPSILEALGAGDVSVTRDLEAFKATISGFPKAEAVTSNAHVFPLEGQDATLGHDSYRKVANLGPGEP